MITSHGMVLVRAGSGLPIFPGDLVITSRRRFCTVVGTSPRQSGSAGRVLVAVHGVALEQEFLPSIVGLKWVPWVPANT